MEHQSPDAAIPMTTEFQNVFHIGLKLKNEKVEKFQIIFRTHFFLTLKKRAGF
tara:strand:- start:3 stop:161 length:159 start_codon:yes stop_codon:yes gene_type:complete